MTFVDYRTVPELEILNILPDLTLNSGRQVRPACLPKLRPLHWGRPISVTKFRVRSGSMVKISSSGTVLKRADQDLFNQFSLSMNGLTFFKGQS